LFGCACCRRFWDLLAEGQAVVVAAERFADGHASFAELEEAGLPASHAIPADAFGHLMGALECLLDPDAINAGHGAAFRLATWADLREQQRLREGPDPAGFGPEAIRSAGERADQAVGRDQCGLIRDIFGNPFRPVAFDPAWRTVAAVAVARAIYDQHHFQELSTLADALEEAGCDNADLLAHLRGPGPHARGCLPVDAVLDKG
jgi:hypothetical protein